MGERAREASNAERERLDRIAAELEIRTHDLETRMRGLLQDWQDNQISDSHLSAAVDHASEGLNTDVTTRDALHREVQKLIGELRKLDEQLTTPSGELNSTEEFIIEQLAEGAEEVN